MESSICNDARHDAGHDARHAHIQEQIPAVSSSSSLNAVALASVSMIFLLPPANVMTCVGPTGIL